MRLAVCICGAFLSCGRSRQRWAAGGWLRLQLEPLPAPRLSEASGVISQLSLLEIFGFWLLWLRSLTIIALLSLYMFPCRWLCSSLLSSNHLLENQRQTPKPLCCWVTFYITAKMSWFCAKETSVCPLHPLEWSLEWFWCQRSPLLPSLPCLVHSLPHSTASFTSV